jgi:hypothetical protein
MVELGGSGNDTTHAQVSGAFHRSEERKMPGTHESTTLSFARFMDRSMAQKRDASYFLPKQRGRGAAGVKRAASAGAHRFLFFFRFRQKAPELSRSLWGFNVLLDFELIIVQVGCISEFSMSLLDWVATAPQPAATSTLLILVGWAHMRGLTDSCRSQAARLLSAAANFSPPCHIPQKVRLQHQTPVSVATRPNIALNAL